jgi:hypothetical protein
MYSTEMSETGTLKTEILDLVTQCMNRIGKNPDRLRSLSTQIRSIRNELYKDLPDEPAHNPKAANISDILNLPIHSSSTIQPPMGIRNKGSGTKKRRVGPGEKIVKRRKRPARLCNHCNKYVFDHDSRNCVKVKEAKRAAYKAKCAAAAANNLPPPRYDVSDNEFDVEPTYASSDSDEEFYNDNPDDILNDTIATNTQQVDPAPSKTSNQPIRRSTRLRRDPNYVYNSESENDV